MKPFIVTLGEENKKFIKFLIAKHEKVELFFALFYFKKLMNFQFCLMILLKCEKI
jgi:hypothetical protein